MKSETAQTHCSSHKDSSVSTQTGVKFAHLCNFFKPKPCFRHASRTEHLASGLLFKKSLLFCDLMHDSYKI